MTSRGCPELKVAVRVVDARDGILLLRVQEPSAKLWFTRLWPTVENVWPMWRHAPGAPRVATSRPRDDDSAAPRALPRASKTSPRAVASCEQELA